MSNSPVLLNTEEAMSAILRLAVNCKKARIATYSFSVSGWVLDLLTVLPKNSEIYISGPYSNNDIITDIPIYHRDKHKFFTTKQSHIKAYEFLCKDNTFVSIVGSLNLVPTNWLEICCAVSEPVSEFNNVIERSSKIDFNETKPINTGISFDLLHNEYGSIKTNINTKLKEQITKAKKKYYVGSWEYNFLDSVLINWINKNKPLSPNQNSKVLALL